MKEITDAYNFELLPEETLGGRAAFVIDAQPRPGFKPHSREGKYLPRFRFRVWIDKAEYQLAKLDAEAMDTVSLGLFLARFHPGSRLLLEQVRVNDEVWLPLRAQVQVGGRAASLSFASSGLLKGARRVATARPYAAARHSQSQRRS